MFLITTSHQSISHLAGRKLCHLSRRSSRWHWWRVDKALFFLYSLDRTTLCTNMKIQPHVPSCSDVAAAQQVALEDACDDDDAEASFNCQAIHVCIPAPPLNRLFIQEMTSSMSSEPETCDVKKAAYHNIYIYIGTFCLYIEPPLGSHSWTGSVSTP